MGRKSTRPVFDTVDAAIKAMTDPTDDTRLTLWGRSGNERAHLTSILHDEDPTCTFCGLETFLTAHKGAAGAVLALLVTSSQIPANQNLRCGYVGGNLVLACRACTDARGTAIKAGQTLTITADMRARAASILTIPTLDRTYRLAPEDGARLAYVGRVSVSWADEAREGRRERGLTY